MIQVNRLEGPIEGYAEEFRLEMEMLRRAAPSLVPHREAFLARLREAGFPTSRNEEWLYTSTQSLVRAPLPRAPEPAAPSAALVRERRILREGTPIAVFVDGRFAPDVSQLANLPRGIAAGSLVALLVSRPALRAAVERWFGRPLLGEVRAGTAGRARSEEAFQYLNCLLASDAACLVLDPDTHLDAPLELLHLRSGRAAGTEQQVAYPRAFIVAGAGSSGFVIESYASLPGAGGVTNALAEVILEENARLEHTKVVCEAADSTHLAAQRARQLAGSRYATMFCGFGGGLVRNEVLLSLEGERCDATMNGLYLADAARHVDNHTAIHHVMPHCHSREVYKGMLRERSRGVFSGKIHVHLDAQKTDAKQSNHTLLLSPDATANTRPRLEIYADDVKCTHGATVGALDANALFYLRSRGIEEADARSLLTRAFAADLLAGIADAWVRQRLEALLERALEAPPESKIRAEAAP